ncbi:unnamed protein product [Clavelina lepadiformis]|uniref:Uncharacterized protein n=1 Tax=Clavelina lepadiformis TaxID=159417 RepID=A0ABP0FCB4_CLALP
MDAWSSSRNKFRVDQLSAATPPLSPVTFDGILDLQTSPSHIILHRLFPCFLWSSPFHLSFNHLMLYSSRQALLIHSLNVPQLSQTMPAQMFFKIFNTCPPSQHIIGNPIS